MSDDLRYYQEFNIDDPKTKEEEIISELISRLTETTHEFLKLNGIRLEFDKNSVFNILCDSSIGFTASIIKSLSQTISDKDQLQKFLSDAKSMFDNYMDTIQH